MGKEGRKYRSIMDQMKIKDSPTWVYYRPKRQKIAKIRGRIGRQSTKFVSIKLILKVKMVNRVIFSLGSRLYQFHAHFAGFRENWPFFASAQLRSVLCHHCVCADFQIIDSTFITRCHAIITSIIGLNFLTSKLTWKTLQQISSSDMGSKHFLPTE